jgi:hypothetical protein
MPDKKISALTAVTTPASTDEFAVNQGGTSKKETRAQIHALQSGEHLVLPQVDEAATPTLAFGDGDSGFYEGTDDSISVAIAGALKYTFSSGNFKSNATGGGYLLQTAASATVPALTFSGDIDTGIGKAAADQLSLIAGGFELLRLADTAPNATLTATVDAASTELLKLVGPTRATSADDDEIYISFNLDVDDGVEEMGRITLLAEDVTTSTEDSRFEFGVRNDASAASITDWYMKQGIFYGSQGGRIYNETASGTNPTLVPTSDADTGVGSAAADQLSLIAGGFELLRLADTAPNATLTATVDAASTEILKLVGPTRATSADGDEAYISFFQDVDDGVEEMGRIRIEALDVSTGTEDSIIAFEARSAGSALSGATDFEIASASVGLGRVAGYPQIMGQAGSATVPTYSWWTDNDSGLGRSAADIIHLIAGGLNVLQVDGTVGTKGQVLLPQEDLAATPTLAFGDGNTGFYESADNVLEIATAGSQILGINTVGIYGAASGSPQMKNGNTTATVPGFNPDKGDTDTGIGAAGADQLSLIAGGIEGLRIEESGSQSSFLFDAGDNGAGQIGAFTNINKHTQQPDPGRQFRSWTFGKGAGRTQ